MSNRRGDNDVIKNLEPGFLLAASYVDLASYWLCTGIFLIHILVQQLKNHLIRNNAFIKETFYTLLLASLVYFFIL